MEQPGWALKEINDRSRRAWDDLYAEERGRDAAARAKAAREKELKEHREEQRRWLADWRKEIEEEEVKRKEDERVRRELREAERLRKRERAAQVKAAEERGDKTGKWPRWTQDH